MRESVIVVLAIVALLTTAALEPTTGIRGGLIVAVIALVLGTLAGFVYHLRLHHALAARDALPRRWWVNPVALHPQLTDEERVDVLPSFVVGAAFFGVCVLGCVAMVSGLARLLL